MAEVFDVVICGYGGSGAAAAIEAHDHGASVVVIEKAAEGGGSTAESGGSVATILDEDSAVEHYLAITEGRTPRDVIAAYVAGVRDLPVFFEKNGASVEPLPMRLPAFPRRYPGTAYSAKPHSDAIGPRVRVQEAGITHGGTSLWNFLRANVERRGIDVRLNLAAESLLRSQTGDITGVLAGTTEFHARKGVILTCGGFGYNPEMLLEHVGLPIPALGPPGRNTGDGIRMAKLAGADLWHMNGIAAGFGYQVPGIDAAWMCVMPTFAFFMVDAHGRRFLNEPSVEHHAAGHALMVRDFHSGEFDRVPSYLVFDERARQAGPIATSEAGANRTLRWSEDNLDEVDKGWIRSAATMEGLAAELGLPVENLVDTAERFDRAARAGGDEFGRAVEEMLPLDQPPYYAIEVRPALFNTQGGPRRDAHGRVVGVSGAPIPRLFSAGELGSIWSALYPGAGNVTEAVVFGRIAGASAAQLS